MQLIISSEEIYIATNAVDFRKSIDGLLAIISEKMLNSAKTGLFVFYNKNKDKVKLLGWHRNGYVLTYKRLERGKFHVCQSEDGGTQLISEQQLSWLLAGLDWLTMSSFDELSFEDFY